MTRDIDRTEYRYWTWMSCRRFTIGVDIDGEGTIVEAAPIAKKFVGQPIWALRRWMRKFGGYRSRQFFNKQAVVLVDSKIDGRIVAVERRE